MKIKGTYLLMLVAMCGLLASGIGLVTNIAGLFFDPVATEIGVSKGQASLMLTICNICFALGGMAPPCCRSACSPTRAARCSWASSWTRSAHASPYSSTARPSSRASCSFSSCTCRRPCSLRPCSSACYALGTVGISMTTRDVFGDANYTRVYPTFSLGGNIANAIFSSAIGFMYDFSCGYVFPLWVMLLMTIATAATIVVAYAKR